MADNTMTTTYTVDVRHDDGVWTAEAREAPTAHTFARTLTKLDTYIREAIAAAEDLPDGVEAGMAIDYHYHGVPQVVTTAASIGVRRHQAAEALAAVNIDARQSANALTAAGYSVRDTARLLGVSPGRVSQMAEAA